jgi:hypothetical protein
MAAVYIMMFSGAFVIAVSAIILLFRKAYVDAATGTPIEFEMPIIGKIKTQSPVIAIAFIGAGLLIYGVHHAQQDQLTITGSIESGQPVTVYIVGIPQFQYTQQNSGPFSTSIPYIPDLQYRAEYVVDGRVATEKYLKITGKQASLDVFQNLVTAAAGEPTIQPKLEVTDEAAKQFLAQQ